MSKTAYHQINFKNFLSKNNNNFMTFFIMNYFLESFSIGLGSHKSSQQISRKQC